MRKRKKLYKTKFDQTLFAVNTLYPIKAKKIKKKKSEKFFTSY